MADQALVLEKGGDILCKLRSGRNTRVEYFRKTNFRIDMPSKVITYPTRHAEYFELGQVVEFDPEDCAFLRGRVSDYVRSFVEPLRMPGYE